MAQARIIDGKLFIEDRGSANGTFVRGQRIASGQKVPVSTGEKVFIGPMPLLLQGHTGSLLEGRSDQRWRWFFCYTFSRDVRHHHVLAL